MHGYLIGPGKERFDVALSLPSEHLAVDQAQNATRMTLKAPGRAWEFRE